MSNCGECGGAGGGAPCTCFVGNSLTSEARGNGSIAHPFNFVPDHIPNPRPCGYIYRLTTVQAIPAATETAVIFNTDGHPFTGNMTNLVGTPTKLTAPETGKYLVGGFVVLSNPGAGNISNLSISKNGTNFEVRKSSQDPSGGIAVMMDIMSLISLTAGDYIELFVRTDLALDVAINDASYDGTFNSPAYLWAQWVGF